MATIMDIKYSVIGDVTTASITFSNGAGVFARVIRKTDSELLIHYINRIVAIDLASLTCEVLCTGVSIR